MRGGVGGYRSSEELIKLIRDGFALNPDIVINYSGYNDCQLLEEYPYINSHMRKMCNYINENVKLESHYQSNREDKATWGVKGSFRECIEDIYSFWKTNQLMIHAVCQVHGVKHITFLQPSLFNGKEWLADYERSYVLNLVYMNAKHYKRDEMVDRVTTFRRLARDDVKSIEWMHDLSDVLDQEDAYIDRVHLNEHGNHVIAEKIAEKIAEYFSM